MKHEKEWFVESVKKNIRTYNNEAFIGIEKLNELVDKLDRSGIPVIPQFVAEYIEKDKDREGGSNVWHALYGLDSSTWNEPNSVYRWVFEDDKNVDVFARAYVNDNYTILKEKRYRLKSIYFWNTYLLIEDGVRYPYENEDYKGSEYRKVIFTESDLKDIDETGFKRYPVEDIE